jgi:hypothetical protein
MDEDGSVHCRLVLDEPTYLLLHKTTQRVFRGTGKLSLGKPPAELALDCGLTGSASCEMRHAIGPDRRAAQLPMKIGCLEHHLLS